MMITMKPCLKCGEAFEPRWLDALKSWSRCCTRCSVLNLAAWIEDGNSDDTVREIHEGEQVGALLREIAKT